MPNPKSKLCCPSARLCRHDVGKCRVKHPENGAYECTRRHKHRGHHVFCSIRAHNVKVWNPTI